MNLFSISEYLVGGVAGHGQDSSVVCFAFDSDRRAYAAKAYKKSSQAAFQNELAVSEHFP